MEDFLKGGFKEYLNLIQESKTRSLNAEETAMLTKLSCSEHLPQPYSTQVLRTISTRFYKNAALVLNLNDAVNYEEIQQGCMMSHSVQNLSIKRFLHFYDGTYYEIIFIPDNPDLTYVYNTHYDLV